MRALLVAEGKHEFGTNEVTGALETLIRRIVPNGETISFVEKLKMSDTRIGHISGRGHRLTRRILSCMRMAAKLNCDALILLIDEDGDRERRREVEEAQNSTLFTVRRAVGIAIQAFDAWMLADEMAMSRILGQTIGCQPAPEELVSPKDVFARLHRDSGCGIAIYEAYAKVAQIARLDNVIIRCPNGFAPFHDRLKQLRI